MFSDVTASKISGFHDACVNATGWADSAPPRFTEGAWKHIELNHRFNSLLWGEEDQARRRDVADSQIAANKRAIDGYHQQRQNAIERIDEALLQRLVGVRIYLKVYGQFKMYNDPTLNPYLYGKK